MLVYKLTLVLVLNSSLLNSVKDHNINITDNMLVKFDEGVNEKGYFASNIYGLSKKEIAHVALQEEKNLRYNEPDDIYISKKQSVKGWETIEESEWIVFSKDRNYEDAQNQFKLKIAYCGANAAVNYRYNKETDSESTSGGGRYYFSVHSFEGRPVNIGKKAKNGKLSRKNLISNINQNCEKEFDITDKKSTRSAKRGFYFLSTLLLIVAYLHFFNTPSFEGINIFLESLFVYREENQKILVTIIFIVISFMVATRLFFNNYRWLRRIE